MKKGFFKFSSKRILSSAMVVSALLVGNATMMYADVHEVEILMQSGTLKGKVVSKLCISPKTVENHLLVGRQGNT